MEAELVSGSGYAELPPEPIPSASTDPVEPVAVHTILPCRIQPLLVWPRPMNWRSSWVKNRFVAPSNFAPISKLNVDEVPLVTVPAAQSSITVPTCKMLGGIEQVVAKAVGPLVIVSPA